MSVRSQRGAALVSVLWLSVVLTLVATTMAAQQRNHISRVELERNQLSARYALQAAEQWLLYQLLESTAARHDGQQPDALVFNGFRMEIEHFPEDHYLNINEALAPELDAVMDALNIDSTLQPQLVDQILDWRDSDSLSRLHGAEADSYLAHAPTKAPGNRPFFHLSELQQVLSVDASLARTLSRALSVHSHAAEVTAVLRDRLNSSAKTEDDEDGFGRPIRVTDTWRIGISAWRGQRPAGELNSIQRKHLTVTGAPFKALSWQLAPYSGATATPGAGNG